MEIELSEVLAKRHLERQEARVKLDAAEVKNVSLKESKAPPEVTNSKTYFGMNLSPCTEQQRLELFCSILLFVVKYSSSGTKQLDGLVRFH